MRYALLAISLLFFCLPQTVSATAYYVDFQCADTSTCGDGTATTTSFDSLDDFTEAARSAGDIAFVRRGMASTTAVSTLAHTSDGTVGNPIIVSADYDNLWSDFATSSQTYTVAVGSTTLTASADQSDIVVGEWLYVESDCSESYNSIILNSCRFAYEVRTVASTSITLYLPYQGQQAGSGKNLRILPSAPRRGSNASGNWDPLLSTDDFWMYKGIHLAWNDGTGMQFTDSFGNYFFDTIFDGGSGVGNDELITLVSGSQNSLSIEKGRINDAGGSGVQSLINATGDSYNDVVLKDTFVTCATSNTSFLNGFSSVATAPSRLVMEGVIVGSANCVTTSYSAALVDYLLRNNSFNPPKTVVTNNTINTTAEVYVEDSSGIGDNFSTFFNGTTNFASLLSTTSASFIRSGGGATSIQVVGGTGQGMKTPFGMYKLFEYPIYTDTSSKQYDVYFMSTSTAGWTENPTAKELWVECYYWNFPTGGTKYRTVTRSTGTVNFTGSTAWQSLSVSCQPTNAGILYLRAYYAKTKESGKMNEFYVDGTPIIQ